MKKLKENNLTKIIAKRLKELRKAHNLTQEQVVEKAFNRNISIHTYQSWEQESREATPPIGKRITLARFYQVPLGALLPDLDLSSEITTASKIKYRIAGFAHFPTDEIALGIFQKAIEGKDIDEGENTAIPLLQQAFDEGLIIVSHENLQRNDKLEKALKDRFSVLREVYVYNLDDIRMVGLRTILLGIAAADIVKRKIQPAMNIAIANGYTVSRVTKCLKFGDLRGVTVFPITVSNSIIDLDVAGSSLVADLAYRFGHQIQVETDKKLIKPRFEIADIVLMGLGTTYPKGRGGLLRRMLEVKGQNVQALWDNCVRGDILYNLHYSFQHKDKQKQGKIYEKTLELDVEPFGPESLDILNSIVQRQKIVIAIVSGQHKDFGIPPKVEITEVCLRGKYANILVTDSNLARGLLVE